MVEIKVIFLLSYDYEFIKNSLPCVYENATSIQISIDKNRVSWAGNKYEFDENILSWIKEFDVKNKISIFEDNFYMSTNTTMQNETRQRQMSADAMGQGGWTIQLDVDEYFIDFKGFVKYINNLPMKYIENPIENPICIAANWLNLFKKDENGYFIVSDPISPIRIATNNPKYSIARAIKSKILFTSFVMIHNTWARSDEEIKFKIKNWGHNNDFDVDEFFLKWKNLTQLNYKTYINFNPTKPYNSLGKLIYLNFSSIKDLILYYKLNPIKVNKFRLFIKNLNQKFLIRN